MSLRSNNLRKLAEKNFDVLVIGGGINGAVSAASLAAKGVKVALIDSADFAGMTSSNSSNLAWGGIKYLESHEYLLVSKLCSSRNHLMKSYPSTVKEIRFLTSIQRGFRFPPFMVYLGSLFYWMLGRFYTQAPVYLSAAKIKQREAIINTEQVLGGFEYSDCYLYDNDARFVFNFVRSSLNNGCIAANYMQSLSSSYQSEGWLCLAKDMISGDELTIRAKVLINACGPLVDKHNQITGDITEHQHVFSKGIHLIVDRVTSSQKVLTFFASDGRPFFVIPMGPKTCIGTTDTQLSSPIATVSASDRAFVLANANRLLKLDRPLSEKDIIAERCGVRPLVIKKNRQQRADWMQLSRKHVIELDKAHKHLSIFGGKLTDCLNIGDEVAGMIKDIGIATPYEDTRWYGEADDNIKDTFFQQAMAMNLDDMTPASSTEPLSQRLWRRYGDYAIDMLESIRMNPQESELLIENAEYIRCEIEHAAKHEMITKLEDFLRRRSKISLVVKQDTLLASPGLKEACQILFGDLAEAKLQEYINDHAATASL